MPKALSRRDQQVLESIFNPLELTSSQVGLNDIPFDEVQDIVDIEKDDPTTKESKLLELKGIELAESSQLNLALVQFAEALVIAPERASVYNNRAQALRLAGRDQEALKDLNRAIELCTGQQLKTKCHALCQRGVLRRRQDELDEARKDFEEAAKLGSHFARTQLVEINPYAALCNQMLRQAFEQLK